MSVVLVPFVSGEVDYDVNICYDSVNGWLNILVFVVTDTAKYPHFLMWQHNINLQENPQWMNECPSESKSKWNVFGLMEIDNPKSCTSNE